jgi:hypothetical protein
MKKIQLTAIAYAFALAIIVFLADRPASRPLFAFVREMPFGDKLGHLLLMGVLSLVVNLSLSCRTFEVAGGVRLLKGSALVLLVVTLEEFSQLFLRTRSFDAFDLLFDYLGIFAFGWCARRLMNRSASRRSETNSEDGRTSSGAAQAHARGVVPSQGDC